MSKFSDLRAVFREAFKQGVCPVDSRQPIADELATSMVAELVDYGVPKDALIGVVDAFLILSTHLKENGYTNLVLLENVHGSLTENQDKYYNKIQSICKKSGIKYYVPPMNNYNRCEMEFDVIIGNPPYQNDKDSGNKRGSGYKALWYEFSKQAFSLVKRGGIVSLITPESAFTGSERFTSLLSGKKSNVDLKKVRFGLNDQFKGVSIDICRWVATNTNDGCMTDVDGNMLDAKGVFKIYNDPMVQGIVDTLVSYDGNKLKFSVSGQYNYAAIADKLKKSGEDPSKAKDISTTLTDTHSHRLIDNGVVKYTSIVNGKDYGKPRVFLSRMKNPYIVMSDDYAMNTESTLVMYTDTIEDADRIVEILDSDFTRNTISIMASNGRISGGDISQLPAVPFEEVLTTEQINYIKEQLK